MPGQASKISLEVLALLRYRQEENWYPADDGIQYISCDGIAPFAICPMV